MGKPVGDVMAKRSKLPVDGFNLLFAKTGHYIDGKRPGTAGAFYYKKHPC